MKKRIVSALIAMSLAVFGLCFLSACVGTDATKVPAAAEESVADYSDEQNWAYLAIGEDKPADLFIICPTVDTQDEFNMSLGDFKVKDHFVGALNMERGIYEDSARLFAPYYKQAAMKVYSLDAADREQYFQIAYADVSAAFAYYLEHYNEGRPIVLAGFSQGADMCYRLLEEYFGDEQTRELLVAAYAIGWPCTKELVEEYPQIVPATGERDTGVVVAFDCEAPDLTRSLINVADQRAYTINPLNWRTDATLADKSLNLGACFVGYDSSIESEVPQFCGAYLDVQRGVVKIPDINVVDYPPALSILPVGSYHVYDYQFFYRNLQQNVADRIDAYLG